jgi:succinate dehydrogenase / fumarate reductase cytochrome b subunit
MNASEHSAQGEGRLDAGGRALAAARPRPVFFNLLQIGLPVGALTSITHRVSGVLLVLGLPLVVYLLDVSLEGPEGYARVAGLFGEPLVKACAVAFAWALSHHALAGIRHLLSDIDIGSELGDARRSAWLVNLGGVALALLAAAAVL